MTISTGNDNNTREGDDYEDIGRRHRQLLVWLCILFGSRQAEEAQLQVSTDTIVKTMRTRKFT